MKRACSIILLILLTMSVFSQTPFYRQPSEEQQRRGLADQNPIHLRPYPVARNSGDFKVYLLVDVMFDLLQFTLNDGKYTANFQMEVILKEEDTKQVSSRLWEPSLTLQNFEDTNRRDRYYFTVDSIIIPAGQYDINYKYQDLHGEQRLGGSLKLVLPDIGQAYAPAEIFLSLSNPDFQPFWLFKYRPLAEIQQIPFNEELKLFSYGYFSRDSLVQVTVSISSGQSSEELFSVDTLLRVHHQLGYFTLDPPTIKWEEGKYLSAILYKTSHDSVIQRNSFQIVWYDKPLSLSSPQYALEALQVILSKQKYKELTSGNKDKQFARFQEYWKAQDPTPSTAFNEIENEFYTRVDSVDRIWGSKFRRYGWRSDPGRIILLYGQPGKVEDNSLRPVNPNLIWTYYLPGKELTFVFEALDGRKRYKLIQQEENLWE